MTDASTFAHAARLGELLRARGWRLALAESCTGGGIAAAVTDIAGSSVWFDRAYVAYSEAAKQAMLGVPAELFAAHGAVSLEVARAMARGAASRAGAEVTLAVTGIAGPSGGAPACPVGTVCFAWITPDFGLEAESVRFPGHRKAVRKAAVHHALSVLIERIASGGVDAIA